MSIPWDEIVASTIVDDPMDTSPHLQGWFAALLLKRLGANLAIGGALCKAWEEGVHWEESWRFPIASWCPNIEGKPCK